MRIRLREPCVDEHRVCLAGYEDRVDVEAAGVGVVDLKGQRRIRLCRSSIGDDAERQTRKQGEERFDHGIRSLMSGMGAHYIGDWISNKH